MAKPIIRPITPFDANLGTTIELIWSGRQMKASTITIRNASTDEVVYQETYPSYKGIHVIPADSELQNNTSYKATAVIIDMDDSTSEDSEAVLFNCYTTPVVGMNRLYGGTSVAITNGYTLDASNIDVQISFTNPSEETGNLLNTWKITLYSSSNVVLDYSDELYVASVSDYVFSGLTDLTEYYLRIEGVTISGMPVDTGLVRFSVHYSLPSKFSNLALENNASEGNIHIQSYAVSITGHAETEPVIYILDKNGNPYAADLRLGNPVTFNESFLASREFTLTLLIRDPVLFKPFLIISDEQGNAYELNYWKTSVTVNGSTQLQYQIYMRGMNQGSDYSLWSNVFTTAPLSTDWLAVILKRDERGLFSLRWINVGARG